MLDSRLPLDHPVQSNRTIWADAGSTSAGARGRIVSRQSTMRRHPRTWLMVPGTLFVIAYRTDRRGTARFRTFGDEFDAVPRD